MYKLNLFIYSCFCKQIVMRRSTNARVNYYDDDDYES